MSSIPSSSSRAPGVFFHHRQYLDPRRHHVRPIGRWMRRHEYDGRTDRISGSDPYSSHRPWVSDHDRVGGGSMEQTRRVRSRIPRCLGDRSESAAPSPAYQDDLSHPPQLILLSPGYSRIWDGLPALPSTDRLGRQSLASLLFRTLPTHGPRHLGGRTISSSRPKPVDGTSHRTHAGRRLRCRRALERLRALEIYLLPPIRVGKPD